MPMQLRIYTINRGALKEFAAEWEEKLVPIRRKVGFQVLGAWTVEATNQFVWLMDYDGPEAWEVKDREYFQSDERRALDPNPARLIARMEEYFVEQVGGDQGN